MSLVRGYFSGRTRLKRVATALLLAAIAVPAALVRSPWATDGVILLLAAACVPEAARIARAPGWLSFAGVAAGLLAAFLPGAWPFAVPLALAGLLLAAMVGRGRRAAIALLFPLYVGAGLGAVRLLARAHGDGEGLFDSRSIVLLVLIPVWMTDILGYVVGSRWGRRLLAPGISPKKTVEGALGGLAGAVGAGAILGPLVDQPLVRGVAAGLAAGTFGPAGDLLESALKRRVGLKDSGSCLPGHGGVLDRIDSLLLATPVAALLLRGG